MAIGDDWRPRRARGGVSDRASSELPCPAYPLHCFQPRTWLDPAVGHLTAKACSTWTRQNTPGTAGCEPRPLPRRIWNAISLDAAGDRRTHRAVGRAGRDRSLPRSARHHLSCSRNGPGWHRPDCRAAARASRGAAHRCVLTRERLLFGQPAEPSRRKRDGSEAPTTMQSVPLARVAAVQLRRSLLGSIFEVVAPDPTGKAKPPFVPFNSPGVVPFRAI